MGACVPTGNAPPYDAGPAPATTSKPSLNVMSTPFEDTFDRPDASEATWPAFEGKDAGLVTMTDAGSDAGADAGMLAEEEGGMDGGLARFVRPEAGAPSNLGPDWLPSRGGGTWRVEKGRLCGVMNHNHGIWLNRTLPVNAKIEYDAEGFSDDGDLKSEAWGDGKSYARGTSYTDATSYLCIFGGWHNTLHVIARLNEHGEDRKVLPVDKTSDDLRQRPAEKGQVYHFRVERTDGKTVRFFVDNQEVLKWADAAPLMGQGHDHFAFNEWEAKVCFDNVKVTPLP
jgi:hypothetical protein